MVFHSYFENNIFGHSSLFLGSNLTHFESKIPFIGPYALLKTASVNNKTQSWIKTQELARNFSFFIKTLKSGSFWGHGSFWVKNGSFRDKNNLFGTIITFEDLKHSY